MRINLKSKSNIKPSIGEKYTIDRFAIIKIVDNHLIFLEKYKAHYEYKIVNSMSYFYYVLTCGSVEHYDNKFKWVNTKNELLG